MERRNHYHNALKDLVKSTTDEELKEYGITKEEFGQKFNEMEKQIDSGKFYPKRISKVRADIAKRISEGKGPLSMKGINLIKTGIKHERGKLA